MQNSLNVLNGSGIEVRTAFNQAIQSVMTSFSGHTDPATTSPSNAFPYMVWGDTANNLVKQRTADNTAWVTIGSINTDGTFNFNASFIKNTPVGNITSTDQQFVNTELDSRIGKNPSYRNKLINNNFDIWQRGNSFTANGVYTADRWQLSNGGGVSAISQQVISPADVINPDGKYFLRFQQTTGSTGINEPALTQKIEGVRTLGGKSVTATIRGRSVSGGNLSVKAYAIQNFGSGGSPSATLATLIGTVLLTTTPQTLSVSGTLPNIAGKTLGTNGDDSLYFQLNFPSNAIFTADIAQAQIEEGAVATPFEQRPIGLEFSLCQRYYEVGTARIIGAGYTAGAMVGGTTPFSATKRTIPTITFSSVSENTNLGTPSTSMSQYSFRIYALTTAAGNAYYTSNFAADAEL